MSYCYDFIKKFRKEGNFCGLDKSEVSRLESYIEIIEMLMKQHLEEKTIVDNFPLGAARHLIPIKDGRRADGLSYVTEQLKAGHKITGKDIQKKLEISNSEAKTTPNQEKKPQPVKTETSQNNPIFPAKVPPADVTVPIPSDPAKPIQPSLATQQAAKVSQFQTGAEVMAHDKDPLEVGKMFQKASLSDCAAIIADPAKAAREELENRAQAFMEVAPQRFQLAVTDLLRNHTSWKVKDILCFGIDAVVEKEGKYGRRA